MAYPAPSSHRVYRTNSASELLARQKEAILKATNSVAMPIVSASEFTARQRKAATVVQPMLPARPGGVEASAYTALAESNAVRATNAYQRRAQYSSACCVETFTGPQRIQQNSCMQVISPANPRVVDFARTDIRKNDNKVVIANAPSPVCQPCTAL